MRSRKLTASAIVSIPFLMFLGEAAGQGPQPGNDKVAAQALFDDARRLVNAQDYAAACPRFADSERLDPSPSTLLNLANCWEKLGRSATAWATYKEAESAANALKREDYMATAQRHADALAPKLSRLTINVPQPIAGVQVKRDGTLIGAAEWGVSIPVDMGTHTVDARAPGYKGWTTNVDVSRDGAQLAIAVPPLDALPADLPAAQGPSLATSATALPAAGPAPAVVEEPRSSGSTQRTVGLIVAGAGIVGFATSGILAWIANGKKQDSLKNCEPDPNRNRCNPTGVSQRDDAVFAGDSATVALGIGATALVAGGVVWLTARPGTWARSGTAVGVVIVPTIGGAIVKGSW